jgi:hypothetical protein
MGSESKEVFDPDREDLEGSGMEQEDDFQYDGMESEEEILEAKKLKQFKSKNKK